MHVHSLFDALLLALSCRKLGFRVASLRTEPRASEVSGDVGLAVERRGSQNEDSKKARAFSRSGQKER